MKKELTVAAILLLGLSTTVFAAKPPAKVENENLTAIEKPASPGVSPATITAVTKMFDKKIESEFQLELNKMLFTQQAHALKMLGIADDYIRLTEAAAPQK